MIPQVQNAEEAKAAVDAARYFPEGMRGISPPWTGLAGMGMDGPVLEKIQEELEPLEFEWSRRADEQ